jgi:ubiquinone/menaquinone biosynthesis C-methylase UbiE
MSERRNPEDGGARSPREHWERVYGARAEDEASWFQAHPAVSLQLVDRARVGSEARIVDVGGGASRLVDALLDAGFRHVAVLDIAEGALATARRRLGARAAAVTWIAADVTSWEPGAPFDLWHDRAVFHFMTRQEEREAYRATLRKAVRPGGQAIIATFSTSGPDRCSGLPVMRYEPDTLAAELGTGFLLLDSVRDEHVTPAGKVQSFLFTRFARLGGEAP